MKIRNIKFIILLFPFILFGQNKSKKKISFSKDVFPLIQSRCLPCHAVDAENPSMLILENYESMKLGGKHGSPIIPYKVNESSLSFKLKPDPIFGEQMPITKRKRLTPEEIRIIDLWISQGAKKN